MESRGKRERLYKMAEQDPIYQVWKNDYESNIALFKQFADTQPEEVKNVLFGYADAGRMMMQRMINIACDNMEFVEDRENSI
jgi:hypothetical protein